MSSKKATAEQLDLAAHNRLKGTLCFHTASAISQLGITARKLEAFKTGPDSWEEIEIVNELLNTLTYIQQAVNRFDITLRRRLEVGNSPSSGKCHTGTGYRKSDRLA